jgi:secondary thiamine-phosphate synthase enzyme
MEFVHKMISLPALSRGCRLITYQILSKLLERRQFRVGLLNIFLRHTRVSVTINKNCCAHVRFDPESWINATVPEGLQREHASEGRSDMPVHVKA